MRGRALRRGGGHATGRLRSRRGPGAACSSRGSRIPRIGRIGRPYYHVRDVALARARSSGRGLSCCPRSAPHRRRRRWGCRTSRRASGAGRRSRSCRPGSGGQRAAAGRGAQGGAPAAFLSSRRVPGYGIAAVCRSCGAPAACAACGGLLRLEEGVVRCVVCEAPGRCAVCGGTPLRDPARGRRARAGVGRARDVGAGPPPAVPRAPPPPVRRARSWWAGRTTSGTSARVGSIWSPSWMRTSPSGVRGSRRASARSPRGWRRWRGRARAGVRSCRQPDAAIPAVQALVRGNPDRFHGDEARRRAAAGFPVGSCGVPRRGYGRPRGRARGSRRRRLAHHLARHVARETRRYACSRSTRPGCPRSGGPSVRWRSATW